MIEAVLLRIVMPFRCWFKNVYWRVAMKMSEIPEKFLKMLKYAERILETDGSSPMAVVVTTQKGDVMGFARKTRVICGLCKWRSGKLDVPSANLRKGLEELNKANLEAEFLLQGDGCFQLRNIGAMRPLKVCVRD